MKLTHLVVAMLLPAAILSGCDMEDETGPETQSYQPSCAQWPHLEPAPDGRCFPAPGYAWLHADASGSPVGHDWAVEWRRGLGFWKLGTRLWPHVVASGQVGLWFPEPGYAWSHLDANGKPIPGDFTVQWSPGIGFGEYGVRQWPHVVAAPREGYWHVEDGYTWAHLDASGNPIPSDFAVVPLPAGTPNPANPDLVADGNGGWTQRIASQPQPQPQRQSESEENPPLAKVDPQSFGNAVRRVAGQQVFQPSGSGLTPKLIETNSDTFFRALGEELTERHLPSWNADYPLIKLGTLSLDQIGQRIAGDPRWTRLASASEAQQAADAGGIVLGIVRAKSSSGQGEARLAVVMPVPGDGDEDGAPFILDGNERLYDTSEDEATRAARGGAVSASDAWQSLADWQWYGLVR